MKKAISVLLAVALCMMLAVTSFAANNAAVADLINFVNSAKGISASTRAQAVAFLEAYDAAGNTDITADIVAQVKALYNEAYALGQEAQTNADTINSYVAKAQAIAAEAGITLSVSNLTVSGNTASATITVSAANGLTVTVTEDLVGTTAGGSTGGSTSGSTGVIKPTGIETESVVVMMAGVFCVLAAAAVGTKKLGLAVR